MAGLHGLGCESTPFTQDPGPTATQASDRHSSRLPPFEGEELRVVFLVLLRAGLPPPRRPPRPFPFPFLVPRDDPLDADDVADAEEADLDLDPAEDDLVSDFDFALFPLTGIPRSLGGLSSLSSVIGGLASHFFRVSFDGFSL